jgi:aldehyde:ferredoxin oxidoreductase
MPAGFPGKVLRVNLTTGETWIDEPPESFFRQYFGGAIGAYYLWTETKPGFDPLGPENVLSFVPGFLAHLPLAALNRVAIAAKSPLTGGMADAQAGGFWGPECKQAGFDAVIVQGRAEHPVYLWIHDGRCEIRDARHLWGLVTGEAEDRIKEELGEPRLRTCLIGPGGENLVRFANIANDLRHFAGRGGLGAVMGSKNLKAVAVRGGPATNPLLKDQQAVREIQKAVNQTYRTDDFLMDILKPYGTPWAIHFNQEHGKLVTRHFERGSFAGADKIDHVALAASILKGGEGCFACPVRCKRIVEFENEAGKVDGRYGGPEYETLAAFGPLLEVDNLETIGRANALCSQYTLDSISCGATIAWAIDCFQRGLITTQDTGGLELRWGDPALLLELIERIAHRRGFGNVLAEGTRRAAMRFGPEAQALATHVKGQEWPMVEPRVDMTTALAYAVCPVGADHMTAAGSDCGPEFWNMECADEGLTSGKIRAYFFARNGGSLIDGFGICRFLVGTTGLGRLMDLLRAATGWQVSLWELMMAGDRRVTLFKAFNAREGLTIKDDRLPPRAFMELKDGPKAGAKLDAAEMEEAVRWYYAVSGWDPETGYPTWGKLVELGLEWVANKVREWFQPSPLPSPWEGEGRGRG